MSRPLGSLLLLCLLAALPARAGEIPPIVVEEALAVGLKVVSVRTAARELPVVERLVAQELAASQLARAETKALPFIVHAAGQEAKAYNALRLEFLAKAADEFLLIGEVPQTPAARQLLTQRLVRYVATSDTPLVVASDTATFTTVREIIRETPELQQRVLAVLGRSVDPARGINALMRAPQQLELVYDLPRTMEQARLWQPTNSFSFADLQRLSALEKRLLTAASGERGTVTRLASAGRKTLAQHARERLQATPQGKTIAILAHQESGALRFTDGSTLPLAEVRSAGDVMLVGCNTVEGLTLEPGRIAMATGGAISVQAAVRYLEEVMQWVSQGSGRYYDLFMKVQGNPVSRLAIPTLAVTVIVAPTALQRLNRGVRSTP